MTSQPIFAEEKNPRGIPKAPFVVSLFLYLPSMELSCAVQENIEAYLGGPEGDVEGPIQRFQDALAYVHYSNGRQH
jgi:hypothetical protein